MVKAVHGGGGRGMRIVEAGQDLAKTFERCASRRKWPLAAMHFMSRRLDRVRHVEVQILGTGKAQ